MRHPRAFQVNRRGSTRIERDPPAPFGQADMCEPRMVRSWARTPVRRVRQRRAADAPGESIGLAPIRAGIGSGSVRLTLLDIHLGDGRRRQGPRWPCDRNGLLGCGPDVGRGRLGLGQIAEGLVTRGNVQRAAGAEPGRLVLPKRQWRDALPASGSGSSADRRLAPLGSAMRTIADPRSREDHRRSR